MCIRDRDSLERLVYSAKCQFADDAEGVEDAVIRKDNLRRLRAALDQFSEEERVLTVSYTHLSTDPVRPANGINRLS